MKTEKTHGMLSEHSRVTFCGKLTLGRATVALIRPTRFRSVTCGHCRRIVQSRWAGLLRR